MPAENDDIAQIAGRIYAARSGMAEVKPPKHRLGIAEIMHFLNDPSRSLLPEEQRALFADPRVRADYRRLKAQATAFELPALAAASSGEVNSRQFEGGTISIHPSRVAGQSYVIFRFSQPSNAPRMILIESRAGEFIKRALPAADAQGEVMLIMDGRNEEDASFLRLLTDPDSAGTFVL
jgi:hypothetical protein